MDFFIRFTREKTPQNNFSSQNFSVENNYFHMVQDSPLQISCKNSNKSGENKNLYMYMEESQPCMQ